MTMEKMIVGAVGRKIARKLNNLNLDIDQSSLEDTITATISDLPQQISEIVEKEIDSESFRNIVVLNPLYLSENYAVYPHIYLVNSQFGTLGRLLEYIETLNLKISYSVIFGEWDMLIVLWSSNETAQEFYQLIKSQTWYRVMYMEVSQISICFKNILNQRKVCNKLEEYIIDEMISENQEGYVRQFSEEVIKSNAICGFYWKYEGNPDGIIQAFVGITISGTSEAISSEMIIEKLLKNNVIKENILDFYEIRTGRPFHFFAKFTVNDITELDRITDVIGFLRIGRAKFDGATFIVASEKTHSPYLLKTGFVATNEAPDFEGISEIATSVLARIGPDAHKEFNELDPGRQLGVISSLVDLTGELHREPSWDDTRADLLQKIVNSFAEEILKEAEDVNLISTAIEIGSCIEGYGKHILRKAVDVVYDGDYGKSQRELKLPTKDFRKLSLGKLISAFVSMDKHKDFEFLSAAINDSIIDEFQKFADERNEWAHEGRRGEFPVKAQIEQVKGMILKGFRLCRWLGGSVLSSINGYENMHSTIRNLDGYKGASDKKMDESRQRRSGVFLSHSSKDSEIAEKIAHGIRALGKDVWYSNWSLSPGDSIAEKISVALKRNDTLIVLLSENSVNSAWVKRELNSTLMSKLAGSKIDIIPVLISKCEIPSLLLDIVYIDMASDYQEGFMELLNNIRKVPNN